MSGKGVRPLGLAVVSAGNGGDGIAYVARLVALACRELTGHDPRLLELAPATPGVVRVHERIRFTGRLAAELAWGPAPAWIFNHVGIARAMTIVPGAVRRPYVVFVNGVEAWDPEIGARSKEVLRGAAARIAISHHTAARVARIHPDVGAIRPCLLGLLPDDRSGGGAVDAELVSRVRAASVLIVGRMSVAERYKGHDQLLECWEEVRKSVPGAQLVVVGRGDDLPRLRARAGELGVADDVLFTGFVSDATVQALLGRVSLFAMPSRGEGFGLVYLEAMRAGLPCIGSDADAAGDLIVDGETGFLVSPDDRAGLAGVVVRLLRDASLRRSCGAAGERRFRAEFTFECFRERFRTLLCDVFGASVVPSRG